MGGGEVSPKSVVKIKLFHGAGLRFKNNIVVAKFDIIFIFRKLNEHHRFGQFFSFVLASTMHDMHFDCRIHADFIKLQGIPYGQVLSHLKDK